MSEDHTEKPDPIEDVRKGLGLLFRAAKGAIEQLPTRRVEEAVLSGAREVGRAIENVTEVIDKQIFKREASGETKTTGASPAPDQPAEEQTKPPTPAPPGDGGDQKGPRVA